MKEIRAYTVNEVAEILKISTRTVYTYINGGLLKATKFGKLWRVSDANLQDFLKNGTNQQNTAV